MSAGIKKKSVVKFILPVIISVTALSVLFLWIRTTAAQRSDFRRIASETYDTVFLSMYPIDAYNEADYKYFRAMTILKADYILPDFSSLQKYIKRIVNSENTVSTVYLGIRPDKITAGELASLTAAYPDLAFEVIVSYPSIEYWKQLPDSKYEQVLSAYCDFLSAADTFTGTHTYFFSAEEWLIANPALYTDNWSLTADAALFVMTNSDYLHRYQVTSDNASEWSASLRQLTAARRAAPTVYPDLSDTAIVFFGDSIIGNYSDGMSVPGVVRGLTNATVYNCGYGGNPAAMNESTIITLPGIVAAFEEQNLSVLPQDTQVCAGIAEYIATPPQTKNLCFVINYGLNDYFQKNPVSSADPYDITTYSGAIRTAVNNLRDKYTDARIFLCTPTYTAYAADEEDCFLEDYVNTVLVLARKLDVEVIDNYHSLGINETNYTIYMTDKTHPNETARFMIAQEIISAVCR